MIDPFYKKNIAKPLLCITRIFMGVIFIFASWEKILYPANFAEIVSNYKVLPVVLINPVAIMLPYLEAVCGVLLIINFKAKGSSLIYIILMFIFISFMFSAFIRNLDIQCGCFTVSPEATKNIIFSLIRDSSLFIIGCTYFFTNKQIMEKDNAN